MTPSITRSFKTAALCVVAIVGSVASAAEASPLDGERWRTRPLVLVAPADHPLLVQVQSALRNNAVRADFDEREMVLFTVIGGQGHREDQPLSRDETRRLLDALGASADGPAIAFLVGKDGSVKLTKRSEFSLEAVFSVVDAMPMRRRWGGTV